LTRLYLLTTSALCAVLLTTGCHSKTPETDPLVRGLALMEDGAYPEARDALISAVAVHTNSLTAHCNLGLTYWLLEDRAAAIASLTRAVELSQGDSRPVEMLAHVLIENDSAPAAHQILTDIETPAAPTLTIMALAAYRAGSSDLARSYLGRALDIDKDYPPALYNMALLCRDTYRTSREALNYYKQFQAVAPEDRHAAETPQAFINMGGPQPPFPFSEEPDTPAPDESGEPVAETPPTPTPTPTPPPTPAEDPVLKLLAKAEKERNRGNIDVALLTLNTTVQDHPDNADAVWALAQLYDKHLGLQERASELYDKFCVLFPKDPRAAQVKKQPTPTPTPVPPVAPPDDEAPLTPGEANFRAGLQHYARQEWTEAIAAYGKALKENPESARSAYNLGLAYKADGNMEKAAAAFTLAGRLEKNMPKALYMLGLTEMQRGNNASALAKLNRLLRVQPDFAKAHYLLGRLYRDEGRPDMAVIHFERFLHLTPEGPSADGARSWLEQHRGN
jgi:tetratricopeptide (TPR) repeat protein